MGFWGMFLVAEASVQPRDVIPALGAEVELASTGGDWSVWRIWTTLSRLSAELGREVEVKAPSPFILCDVYDSDGARLDFVIPPAQHSTAYLNLDRLLDHIHTPPSPFDAEGNEVDPAVLEDHRHERAATYEQLRVPPETAAPAALAWARGSGLTPRATEAELIALFDSNEAFVEDTFDDLLKALGLATT